VLCVTGGGEESTDAGEDERGFRAVAVGFCLLLTFSLGDRVQIELLARASDAPSDVCEGFRVSPMLSPVVECVLAS
jgi:hypothetical protein